MCSPQSDICNELEWRRKASAGLCPLVFEGEPFFQEEVPGIVGGVSVALLCGGPIHADPDELPGAVDDIDSRTVESLSMLCLVGLPAAAEEKTHRPTLQLHGRSR